jgi:chemotaxis signal transduction protein
LAFAAGEVRFALPLERVRAVIDAATLSTGPSLPPNVVGVIGQGSSLVPVLDLCEKLELVAATPTTCVLLLETGSQQLSVLGVAVERVEHVSVLLDKIEQLPQRARSRVPCLGQVAYCSEGLLLLLDPARLLSAAELTALADLREVGT